MFFSMKIIFNGFRDVEKAMWCRKSCEKANDAANCSAKFEIKRPIFFCELNHCCENFDRLSTAQNLKDFFPIKIGCNFSNIRAKFQPKGVHVPGIVERYLNWNPATVSVKTYESSLLPSIKKLIVKQRFIQNTFRWSLLK